WSTPPTGRHTRGAFRVSGESRYPITGTPTTAAMADDNPIERRARKRRLDGGTGVGGPGSMLSSPKKGTSRAGARPTYRKPATVTSSGDLGAEDRQPIRYTVWRSATSDGTVGMNPSLTPAAQRAGRRSLSAPSLLDQKRARAGPGGGCPAVARLRGNGQEHGHERLDTHPPGGVDGGRDLRWHLFGGGRDLLARHGPRRGGAGTRVQGRLARAAAPTGHHLRAPRRLSRSAGVG